MLASMKTLLHSNSRVEVIRLPELFYVPEKKTELHTFAVGSRKVKKYVLQQEMKIPLFFSVARTKSGRIFGFGGKEIESKKITNKCFELELFTNNPLGITTKFVSCMWERRSRASICSNSEFIFIIGGSNDAIALNSCESYDFVNDRFSPLPPLCYERENAAVCLLDERYIYMFGGYTNTKATDKVEVLDL